MFLNCHMTLRGHIKNVPYDLIAEENCLPCAHSTRFANKRSCGREDRTLLFCHLTSLDRTT